MCRMKTSDNLDVPTSRGWHVVVGKQTERNCLPKKERGDISAASEYQVFAINDRIVFLTSFSHNISSAFFSILSTIAFVFVLLFVIYRRYSAFLQINCSYEIPKSSFSWTKSKNQTLYGSSQTEVKLNISDEWAENEPSHCSDVFDSTWSKLDLCNFHWFVFLYKQIQNSVSV